MSCVRGFVTSVYRVSSRAPEYFPILRRYSRIKWPALSHAPVPNATKTIEHNQQSTHRDSCVEMVQGILLPVWLFGISPTPGSPSRYCDLVVADVNVDVASYVLEFAICVVHSVAYQVIRVRH